MLETSGAHHASFEGVAEAEAAVEKETVSVSSCEVARAVVLPESGVYYLAIVSNSEWAAQSTARLRPHTARRPAGHRGSQQQCAGPRTARKSDGQGTRSVVDRMWTMQIPRGLRWAVGPEAVSRSWPERKLRILTPTPGFLPKPSLGEHTDAGSHNQMQ
jgi:hypothetical protein